MPTLKAAPALAVRNAAIESLPQTETNAADAQVLDDSFLHKSFEQSSQRDMLPRPAEPATPSSPKTLPQAPAFPMTQVVDQEHIKQALILAATNPQLGVAGVLMGGRHGTCKSVLARSVINFVPPIENGTNDDNAISSPKTISFTTVPLNVMEESLLGSVDIEESMATGRTCFSPGLLAKAHQGILYVDDIHLLEDHVANILRGVLADGYAIVEREGLSVKYPCRPQLVVATYNPEEGDLGNPMIDRFAMSLSSDARPLEVDQRVQVVENVESFHPGKEQSGASTESPLTDTSDDASVSTTDQDILQNVISARALLPQVKINSDQILYICQQATRARCEGQRGELFATEIAKTVAALHGRDHVTDDDLQYGVWLAIAPRAQVPFTMEEAGGEEDTDTQDDRPAPDQTQPHGAELQPLEPDVELPPPTDKQEDENEEEEHPESMDEDTQSDNPEEEKQEEVEELEIPKEFLIGVDFDIPVDPALLLFHQKLTRQGKGGKRAKIFSTSRGRFVKAIFPKAGAQMGRLAIGATLRAAAPHQKLRRQRKLQQKSLQHGRRPPMVQVTKDDFRIQRMARKAGTLIVFVVDASGSMALNRMGAAKGAAMLLLKEAYKCRDKIALIAFHGSQAQLLVPPTKSMALTKSRLESMPCGGGSPLAHALESATRVALNEIRVKKDVGRAIIVLLTDGRANVPLSVSLEGENSENNATLVNGISSDRKLLREEVISLAKQMSAIKDLDLLCIDTEDQYVGTGVAKEVARAALGEYQHLTTGAADTQGVMQLVQQGMREAKS